MRSMRLGTLAASGTAAVAAIASAPAFAVEREEQRRVAAPTR